MDLIKIRLNELDAFCQSELFRAFSVKPISPLRVKSYRTNPRARETDVVLYLLIDQEKQPAAFRTVWADMAYPEEDTSIRFGWCSGIWVNPQYRGQQLWKVLLQEALKDWEEKLMLTNYANMIPSLYTKDNSFLPFHFRKGYRFYLYPDFSEILKNRIPEPLQGLLVPANYLARWIYNLKRCFLKSPDRRITSVESGFPDEDCRKLLDANRTKTLFRRGPEELEWIINYPWVTETKDNGFYYPFSYDGIPYRIKTVKYFVENEMSGFFIYSVINRKMKVLYHYETEKNTGILAGIIIRLALQEKISHLTILSESLSQAVKSQSAYFLFHKPFNMHLYASFPLPVNKKLIFDGDGDYCFT